MFDRYKKSRWVILVCIVVVCFLWWKVVRFPPQIFGTLEDHFRTHIIDPMPPSASKLKVAFDDLIIHPDVTYRFCFKIEPHDLETIIQSRSLQKVSYASSGVGDQLSWWNVDDLHDPEVYVYRSSRLYLALWWDASEKKAYYLFATF